MMHIGIIEVCELNHYTAVLALAETYAVNQDNEIYIFTIESISSSFKYTDNRIKLVTKPNDQSIADFLKEISSLGLDRVHINTISHYYKEFAETDWSGDLYFTVHNIELWFDNPLSGRVSGLIHGMKESLFKRGINNRFLPLILFIKDFVRQYYRKVFIRKISKIKHKILVYSSSQQKYLFRYVEPSNTIVFPFCLYGNLKDTSIGNPKIRVCIPGSVSDKKRDYSSFFRMLIDNVELFKEKMSIDLLGFIPESDRHLLTKVRDLQNLGIDISYNLGFITSAEFDIRLAQADIVLGNLRSAINLYQRYGETKETGVIFNMIKAGKPGLLPSGYPVDDSLKDMVIPFSDYNHLLDILRMVVANSIDLNALKAKALETAKYYQPSYLYQSLVD